MTAKAICLIAIFTAPAIAQQINAVLNTASGTPDVSPGALVSIFGSGFPDAVLDGAVTVNGIGMPMYSVTASQINTQIPFDVRPGAATVKIERDGASVTYNFVLFDASPGIFKDPSGFALARNADGSTNGPTKPAAPGSTIFVYLTGIGPVNHPSTIGEITPNWPIVAAVQPAGASIGGKRARAAFLGLTPGGFGMAQVNIVVPPLPDGNYPVSIVIGQHQSNSALISVGLK
jgi:uncharacterized protein (TIGR03437 family)